MASRGRRGGFKKKSSRPGKRERDAMKKAAVDAAVEEGWLRESDLVPRRPRRGHGTKENETQTGKDKKSSETPQNRNSRKKSKIEKSKEEDVKRFREPESLEELIEREALNTLPQGEIQVGTEVSIKALQGGSVGMSQQKNRTKGSR